LEFSEQPGTSLEKVNKFDYSQFSDVKSIGSRKFVIVFSTTFEDRRYANNNLQIDIKTIEQIKREIENLHDIKHENIVKLYGISKGMMKI
ncbi:6542_t:CDS:2, partial [Gigaspora rosea]